MQSHDTFLSTCRPGPRALGLALALLAFAAAGPAAAVEIVPVAQSRFFAKTGYPTQSATDFGPFDVSGKHHSTIGANTLTADLSAAGFIIDSSLELAGTETSTFSLDFDLAEQSSFDLSAVLHQQSPIFPANGRSEVSLYAFDTGLATFVLIFDYLIQGEYDYSDWTVDEHRRLDPGTYRVFASAQGDGIFHSYYGAVTSSATTSFLATVSTVPEPGSGVLAALGVAMLAARRRRTRTLPAARR